MGTSTLARSFWRRTSVSICVSFYIPGDHSDALKRLSQTAVTQPAMFVVEYAMARLWMDAGVVPNAMIGHSIGEYVAACLAGVFSLEDALTLVAGRGRLMQSMPRGSMLAVRLEEASLRQSLGSCLDLAVVNGPMACVAAGPTDAILELQASLAEKSIESRLLATSHGFHSRMMEPALEPFRDLFRNIKLSPAKIPFLSNVTGAWITAARRRPWLLGQPVAPDSAICGRSWKTIKNTASHSPGGGPRTHAHRSCQAAAGQGPRSNFPVFV